jgi:hypothetical protein
VALDVRQCQEGQGRPIGQQGFFQVTAHLNNQ